MNPEHNQTLTLTYHSLHLMKSGIGIMVLYSCLNDLGLDPLYLPSEISVIGKKHEVVFLLNSTNSWLGSYLYLPTPNSKHDVPACVNYELLVYRNKKDMP